MMGSNVEDRYFMATLCESKVNRATRLCKMFFLRKDVTINCAFPSWLSARPLASLTVNPIVVKQIYKRAELSNQYQTIFIRQFNNFM